MRKIETQKKFDAEDEENNFLFPFVKEKLIQSNQVNSKNGKIKPICVQDIFDYKKLNLILSNENYLLETVVLNAMMQR